MLRTMILIKHFFLKPACLYGVFRTLLKLTYLAYSTAYQEKGIRPLVRWIQPLPRFGKFSLISTLEVLLSLPRFSCRFIKELTFFDCPRVSHIQFHLLFLMVPSIGGCFVVLDMSTLLMVSYNLILMMFLVYKNLD